MRKIRAFEVSFEVYTRPDDLEIEGNVMASGDAAADRDAEQDVRARLEAGDETAWCGVCVKATWSCAEGVEYIGTAALWGCSLSPDYTAEIVAKEHDLNSEALSDLQARVDTDLARCASIARKLKRGKRG